MAEYKPRLEVTYYYRCPKCTHVSVYVSYTPWIVCGGRWCGKRFHWAHGRISRAEYDRVWGI